MGLVPLLFELHKSRLAAGRRPTGPWPLAARRDAALAVRELKPQTPPSGRPTPLQAKITPKSATARDCPVYPRCAVFLG